MLRNFVILFCVFFLINKVNSNIRNKRQVSFGFGFPPPARQHNHNTHNAQATGQAIGQAIGGTINSLLGGLLGGGGQQNQPQGVNPFGGGGGRGCNINNGGCEQGCVVRRLRVQCFCNPGYVLDRDGKSCIDIDECGLGPHQVCQGQCQNTKGSYQCTCPNGILLEDGTSCGQAEATCAVQNGGCEQVCNDIANGGIQCTCQKGYVLAQDQRTCVDIDECSSGSHNCPAGQACINTIGGFECSAEGGTSCDINNGGCEQRCRENRKGIRCLCRKGFELQSDGKSCEPIDGGCRDNNGGCEQRCRSNRRGIARCTCRKGFVIQSDGKSCKDIDECQTGKHNCPDICVNKPGTFQCKTQEQIDGCGVNNGGCEQKCKQNKKGVIRCTCNKGFEIQPDEKSCSKKGGEATDPCLNNNGGCDQICVNNAGAVKCECRDGFIWANGRCNPDAIIQPTPAPVVSSPKTPQQQKGCGVNTKKSLFRRIVGGKPADPKDWPWMAAILRNSGSQFCGGALITDRHVLTAAHCVVQFTKDDIKVRLGEYNFDTPDENNPTDFRVVEIKSHESYSQQTQENDIAIIKLARPSSFSEFIWPVCLPPPNNEFEDQLGYVTGWGTIFFGGPVSNVLQEIVIPVWKQADCAAAYPENTVSSTMMCAGLKAGGKDSCQGDSGGPFLVQIFPETRWYVAGVVSWGIECASANRPGVYTRVNKYLDWIKANSDFN